VKTPLLPPEILPPISTSIVPVPVVVALTPSSTPLTSPISVISIFPPRLVTRMPSPLATTAELLLISGAVP